MNFERIVNSKFYNFLSTLYNYVIINMIWFFLSFIGLGIFTIFPAMLCVYILINTYLNEQDFPIFKTFFKVFGKIYWKAQKVFIVFFMIGIILYFNVRIYYFQVVNQITFINSIGFWITCIIILIYFLALIQVFYIFLYFPEYKTFKTIKFAFLMAIGYLFSSLLILILTIAAFFVIFLYPILFPLIFIILISALTYVSLILIKPKYQKILPNKKALDVFDFSE